MKQVADIDVIVGGGGVAGMAAAAAIHQLGYRVMVIEPGLNDDRRLAGEIFHPPGVIGLAELGLLDELMRAPAVKVDGFSVSCDGDGGVIQLPYDAVPAHSMPGLCLEHDLIRKCMLNAVSALPNVTIKRGLRVVGIKHCEPSSLMVDVAGPHTATTIYCCRMFVAADGTPSRLARLAGIPVHNRRISTIWGYRVGVENLPHRDYGHVFLGSGTPVLLYPINREEARILLDVPYQADRRITAADCVAMVEPLPSRLRREVEHAIATQAGMSASTQGITAEKSVQGRVVLVGDAGGCCHPLTATGMTMCVSDALLLRNALSERAGDVPAGLRLYQQRRRWPQATRLALADALRDALCATSPEMRVVRAGILNYWRGSAAGRTATLALLSTADGRPLAMLRQIVAVMARGFIGHLRNPKSVDRSTSAIRVAQVMLASLLRHTRQVLIGPPIPAHERSSATRQGSVGSPSSRLTADDRPEGIPADPGITDKPRHVNEIEQQIDVETLVFKNRIARNVGDAEIEVSAIKSIGRNQEL
jgi:squalene monooxygenase